MIKRIVYLTTLGFVTMSIPQPVLAEVFNVWSSHQSKERDIRCEYVWIGHRFQSLKDALSTEMFNIKPSELAGDLRTGKWPHWATTSTAISVYSLERHENTEHVKYKTYISNASGGTSNTEDIEVWCANKEMIHIRHDSKSAIVTSSSDTLYATYYVPEMTYLYAKSIQKRPVKKGARTFYPESFTSSHAQVLSQESHNYFIEYLPLPSQQEPAATVEALPRDLSAFPKRTATVQLNQDGLPKYIFTPSELEPKVFLHVKEYAPIEGGLFPLLGIYGITTSTGAHGGVLIVDKASLALNKEPLPLVDIALIPDGYHVSDNLNQVDYISGYPEESLLNQKLNLN